jgi:glycosyltransferase involved in cell wall biosynthesis
MEDFSPAWADKSSTFFCEDGWQEFSAGSQEAKRMTDPIVSILIPTRNRAHFLPMAVQSALRQDTDQPYEIVVSDNASTDDTPRLAAEWSDPRLRYIRSERSLGIAENWFNAFRHARGEWITYLFDDDMLLPEFLSRHLAALREHPGAVLSFSDHWVTNEQGIIDERFSDLSTARFGRNRLKSGRYLDFADLVLRKMAVPIVSALIQRQAIDPDDFAQKADSLADVWLLYHLSRRSRGAVYVPERLMMLRGHGSSVTASPRLTKYRGAQWLYQQLLAHPDAQAYRSVLRRRLADAYACEGIALLKLGKPQEARPLLRRAIRVHPDRRSLVALAIASLPARATMLAAHRISWIRSRGARVLQRDLKQAA